MAYCCGILDGTIKCGDDECDQALIRRTDHANSPAESMARPMTNVRDVRVLDQGRARVSMAVMATRKAATVYRSTGPTRRCGAMTLWTISPQVTTLDEANEYRTCVMRSEWEQNEN